MFITYTENVFTHNEGRGGVVWAMHFSENKNYVAKVYRKEYIYQIDANNLTLQYSMKEFG